MVVILKAIVYLQHVTAGIIIAGSGFDKKHPSEIASCSELVFFVARQKTLIVDVHNND